MNFRRVGNTASSAPTMLGQTGLHSSPARLQRHCSVFEAEYSHERTYNNRRHTNLPRRLFHRRGRLSYHATSVLDHYLCVGVSNNPWAAMITVGQGNWREADGSDKPFYSVIPAGPINARSKTDRPETEHWSRRTPIKQLHNPSLQI